jgi:hypothetical protein
VLLLPPPRWSSWWRATLLKLPAPLAFML